ncbi:MAG TPA: hypothetical protein VE442_15455 [Jatrophihabitans sp.]|nr:hypothetical protein [Jatrophihabitans sp.]
MTDELVEAIRDVLRARATQLALDPASITSPSPTAITGRAASGRATPPGRQHLSARGAGAMNRHYRARRNRAERAVGGMRNAARAEQLRAVGMSDRAVARKIGIPVEAVSRWFALQDELALTGDVDGAA